MASHQQCRTCRVGGVWRPFDLLKGLPHASPGVELHGQVAVLSRAASGLACGRALPGRGDATRPPDVQDLSVVTLG